MSPATRVMLVEPEGRRRNQIAAAICSEPSLLLADSVACGRRSLERLAQIRPEVLLAGAALADPRVAEFVRCAREILASCDILTIVPQGHEHAGLESLAAGAGWCLPDGCSGTDLAAHIRHVRNGGCPVSPSVARLLLERLRDPEAARPQPVPGRGTLTTREIEVLQQLARGCTYAQAAEALSLSAHTVAAHVKNMYRKLAVRSAGAAVMRAIELRIIGGAEPMRCAHPIQGWRPCATRATMGEGRNI